MSITPVYLSIKTINYTDYAGLPKTEAIFAKTQIKKYF
jgi:hypothetical protein